MNKATIIQEAVRGTDDYHSLMRSIVFNIVAENPQICTSEIDKFSDIRKRVYQWEKNYTYYPNTICITTVIEIDTCYSCARDYARGFEMVHGLPPHYESLIQIIPISWNVKFPNQQLGCKGVYICPICGDEAHCDDIPF